MNHVEKIDAIAFFVDGGNVSLGTAWATESSIASIIEQNGGDSAFANGLIVNPAEYPNWSPDIQEYPGLNTEMSRLSAITEADYARFGESYLVQGWDQRLDSTLSEFLVEAIQDSALRLQKLPLTPDALVYVYRHDAGDLENYFTLRRTLSRETFSRRLAAYGASTLAGDAS